MKKKEVKKKLREWRRRREKDWRYREKRSKYGDLCERKKREDNKKWEKNVMEAKRKSEMWEVLNKEKRTRRVNGNIKREEWKNYFRVLLGKGV